MVKATTKTVNETAAPAAAPAAGAAAPADATPSFELEDAPLYERSRRRPGASIYPWAGMQKGQRFFVPNKTVKEFSGTVSSGRKSTGFTFDVYLNSADVPNPKEDAAGNLVPGVWVQRVEDRPIVPRRQKAAAAATDTGTAGVDASTQAAQNAAVMAAQNPVAAAPAPLARSAAPAADRLTLGSTA